MAQSRLIARLADELDSLPSQARDGGHGLRRSRAAGRQDGCRGRNASVQRDLNEKRQGRSVAVIRSVIRGVGAHLPKRVMTNADLAKIVDTSDEWIVERTGIRERHIADEGELTSDLGIAAAKQALVRAAIDPDRHRSRHLRHGNARPHLSRDRGDDPARARRHQGRGVRRAGGVLGLRLRAHGRRQFPQDGPVQARRRGRRRDLLAHSRLDRPLDLRAVRRRGRRRRARGAAAAWHARRSRHPCHAHPLRRAFRGSALRRRRARARPRRSGTCA